MPSEPRLPAAPSSFRVYAPVVELHERSTKPVMKVGPYPYRAEVPWLSAVAPWLPLAACWVLVLGIVLVFCVWFLVLQVSSELLRGYTNSN